MEMYKGIKCSPFKQLKDEIPNVLNQGGKVITFGYHSNTMGQNRGFTVEKICLFSHGGAIHDTIASVERYGTIEVEKPDWCTEDKHIPGCSCP